MKLTRHNGRFGKNGVFNPKHNDRRFDVENSEHIDPERTKENVYWDCYQGFHYAENREQAEQIIHSFEEIEMLYYWEHYEDYCNAQHERNQKTGHTERNRSPDDLRLEKKTCPEETVFQIGTREEHISGEMLRHIIADFFEEFEKRFGKHVHILNWSLHMDEGTPHIHERHVFDCPNRYGEICPQQEKALEVLGIEMPFLDKKRGKMNNRKVTFDAICRAMLFDITKRYGLELDEEPEYGGRDHLEKQDYILMKQNQLIAERKAAIAAEEEKLTDRQDAVKREEALLRERTAAFSEAEKRLDEQEREEKEKREKLLALKYEIDLTQDSLAIKRDRLAFTEKNLEEVNQKIAEAGETLAAQKQAVAAEERKLADLEARIQDTESFIEEISETAYDEAVAVVSEKAAEEARNMFFDEVSQFREDLLTGGEHSVAVREYLYKALGPLIDRFRGLTQHITDQIRHLFSEPVQKEKFRRISQENIRKHLYSDSSRHTYSDQTEGIPPRRRRSR